jgi:UDP-2,3-diacylglucosamine hydrolase
MNSIFFSDVHIQDNESTHSKLIYKFIKEEASRYKNIYILGDLFDVWPCTRQYLLKRYSLFLDLLQQLAKNGHRIIYIEGNHDFKFKKYFETLGLQTFQQETAIELGAKKIHLSHGDLANPYDESYPRLRKTLRSPLLHFGLNLLPSKWVFKLGSTWSNWSRGRHDTSASHQEKIRNIYRESAEKKFSEGFDVVLMGHTHIPDDYQITLHDKKHRYLNLGDLLHNFTYVVFEEGEFYTKKYHGHK